ncbi:MAG TPA: hypothetical protein VGA99_12685 [bacterium]
MWRLLKAEMQYQRRTIFVGYLLSILILIAGQIRIPNIDFEIVWVPFIAVSIALYHHYSIEKRTRLHLSLPLTLKQQIVAPLVFPFGFNVCIVPAYFLVQFFGKGWDDPLLWIRLAVLGGLPLVWMLTMWVNKQLKFHSTVLARLVLLTFILPFSGFIIVSAGELMAHGSALDVSGIQYSPLSPLVVYLIAAGLGLLGVRFYAGRRSFLE